MLLPYEQKNIREFVGSNRRPIILNGITEVVTRGDLLDRAIVIYLPSIDEIRRRPEAELWAEYETAKPGIIGALLNAVVHAFANWEMVELERLSRMADFAVWACAAAPVLGFDPEEFLQRYGSNRKDAYALTLEASPIYEPLIALLASAHWEATASELLIKLEVRLTGGPRKPRAGRAMPEHCPVLSAAWLRRYGQSV